MRVSGLKGVAVGCVLGALATTATVAIAGNGIGGVFNLGQANSVDAPSTLSGTTNGTQLNVWNLANAAAARALVVYGKSPSAPAAVAQNAGGGPALALAVNAGKAPMTVNSSTKVASLNADQVDGLDSSAFQPHYAHTVVVHPVGTPVDNGYALHAALQPLLAHPPANPTLVKIEPGIYELQYSISMPQNTDVEGSGQGVTTITMHGWCIAGESYTVDGGFGGSELRDVTIENTGGCPTATAIEASYSITLRRVTARASGGSVKTRALWFSFGGHYLSDVTAVANGAGSADAAAIDLYQAEQDPSAGPYAIRLENVDARADGSPTGHNYALLAAQSTALVQGSRLTAPTANPTVSLSGSSKATVEWTMVDGGAPSVQAGSTFKCASDYTSNAALVPC
ncbi:MAG: hypothetical protein QOE36_3049 [Gaiellaceae bacterium]|jgi:hypothetical protein|nr:hypothetical protein [Gaiellaceae bacterium]